MFVSFKKVFDVLTKQDEVFDVVARPVIDKLVALALFYFVAYNSSFIVLSLLNDILEF